MNHNGIAVIKEIGPELHLNFQNYGSKVYNLSAWDMSGHVLYHLSNVVNTGDAPVRALVVRFDLIHAATRCDELTEYNVEAVKV